MDTVDPLKTTRRIVAEKVARKVRTLPHDYVDKTVVVKNRKENQKSAKLIHHLARSTDSLNRVHEVDRKQFLEGKRNAMFRSGLLPTVHSSQDHEANGSDLLKIVRYFETNKSNVIFRSLEAQEKIEDEKRLRTRAHQRSHKSLSGLRQEISKHMLIDKDLKVRANKTRGFSDKSEEAEKEESLRKRKTGVISCPAFYLDTSTTPIPPRLTPHKMIPISRGATRLSDVEDTEDPFDKSYGNDRIVQLSGSSDTHDSQWAITEKHGDSADILLRALDHRSSLFFHEPGAGRMDSPSKMSPPPQHRTRSTSTQTPLAQDLEDYTIPRHGEALCQSLSPVNETVRRRGRHTRLMKSRDTRLAATKLVPSEAVRTFDNAPFDPYLFALHKQEIDAIETEKRQRKAAKLLTEQKTDFVDTAGVVKNWVDEMAATKKREQNRFVFH